MFRTMTALTLVAALAASPAIAKDKPVTATGGTSHGSSAPADNVADQLNDRSLGATQSGGAYAPSASDAQPGGGGTEAGISSQHHAAAHHGRHHRRTHKTS